MIRNLFKLSPRSALGILLATLTGLAPAADKSLTINGTDDENAVVSFVAKFEGEDHSLDITVSGGENLAVRASEPTGGLWKLDTDSSDERTDGALFRFVSASADLDHAAIFTFTEILRGGGGGGGGRDPKTFTAISQQIQIFAHLPGDPTKRSPRPTKKDEKYYGFVIPALPTDPAAQGPPPVTTTIQLVYNRTEIAEEFYQSELDLIIPESLTITPDKESVLDTLEQTGIATFTSVYSAVGPAPHNPPEIKLTVTDYYETEEDAVTLLPVGVSYDADNDNGFEFPAGGPQELEYAREIAAGNQQELLEKPGKILYAMNGDMDGDGLPDFADGFNDASFLGGVAHAGEGIGRTGHQGPGAAVEYYTPQCASLCPIVLKIPEELTEDFTVKINYDASDPEKMRYETVENRNYYRLPESGDLRLWSKNRMVEDCSMKKIDDEGEPGDFLPSGIEIDDEIFNELTYNEEVKGFVLWVESMAASEEIRDHQIEVEIKNGEEQIILSQTLYFSSIDLSLAQVVPQDGGGSIMRDSAGQIELSHPSPIIDVEVTATKPRLGMIQDAGVAGESAFGWIIDVTVKGRVTSKFLDTLTAAQGGTIDKAYLYVNGADQPAREISVGVSKTRSADPHDLVAPFPYLGTIDQTFTGVAAVDGVNVIDIRTADSIYQLDGYSQHAYTVEFPEIPEEGEDGYDEIDDIDDETPGEYYVQHQTIYDYQFAINYSENAATPDLITSISLNAEGDSVELFPSVTESGRYVSLVAPDTEPADPAIPGPGIPGGGQDSGQEGAVAVTLVKVDLNAKAVPGVEHFYSMHLEKGFINEGWTVDMRRVLEEVPPGTLRPVDPESYAGQIVISSIYSFGNIAITPVVPIDVSDGGEFHPYVWAFGGPRELLESFQGMSFTDKSETGHTVEIGGGAASSQFDVDITAVEKEMEETARAEQEARERMIIANALEGDAAGIVSFRCAGEDLTPGITDELYASVSRVRSMQLMPEDKVDFAAGFAVGMAKGGVEMIGGVAGVVVATGKIIYKTGETVVRGTCWHIKVTFKTLTGQDLTMEYQQAAEAAARARKAGEEAVKIATYFKELLVDGGDAVQAVLTGDFEKLNHMSGHMRMIISSSIKIFEGIFASFEVAGDYEKGVQTGRATFEIASCFVPWGAAFKAINVAGKVSKANLLTNLASKSKFFQAGGNGAKGLKKARDLLMKPIVNLVDTKMCFVAGTLIATAHATDDPDPTLIPIEQIQPGSLVWSLPEDGAGNPELKRVLQTFVTHPTSLNHLSLDHDQDGITDQKISGTYQHPFWDLEKKSWIEMGELKPGQKLRLLNGKPTSVLLNQRQNAPPGQTFTTYNFEVEDFHTYFVGENGVWVHNDGPPCERIFSTFAKKAKNRPGGSDGLRKDRFKLLQDTKTELRNASDIPSSSWAQSVKDVQSKMAKDLSAGTVDVIDMPSVTDVRAFNRRQPRGTDGNHVHHSVETWIQRDKLGLANGFDDVPGWMIDGTEHTFGPGRPLTGTLAGDLADAMRPIAAGKHLEVTKAIKQVYQNRGMDELWDVTKAWLDLKGFPTP